MKELKELKYELRIPYYADGEKGRIWSENSNKYLSEQEDKDGYKKVTLMTTDRPPGKGHLFSVHRLILEAYQPIENSKSYEVDHIDGDKQNNKLANLRWVTTKENINNPNTLHKHRSQNQNGLKNTSSKFSSQEHLYQLVEDINSGYFKRKDILKKYSISEETLRRIQNKMIYKEELLNVEITPNYIQDMGRDVTGVKNPKAKLNDEKVKEIVKLLLENTQSQASIAKKFGVSTSTISDIKGKRSWKHITKNIDFN